MFVLSGNRLRIVRGDGSLKFAHQLGSMLSVTVWQLVGVMNGYDIAFVIHT